MNTHEVESGKTVEEVERENRREGWLKALEVKRRLAHDSGAGRGADALHVAGAYLGLRDSPILREVGVCLPF